MSGALNHGTALGYCRVALCKNGERKKDEIKIRERQKEEKEGKGRGYAARHVAKGMFSV